MLRLYFSEVHWEGSLPVFFPFSSRLCLRVRGHGDSATPLQTKSPNIYEYAVELYTWQSVMGMLCPLVYIGFSDYMIACRASFFF